MSAKSNRLQHMLVPPRQLLLVLLSQPNSAAISAAALTPAAESGRSPLPNSPHSTERAAPGRGCVVPRLWEVERMEQGRKSHFPEKLSSEYSLSV